MLSNNAQKKPDLSMISKRILNECIKKMEICLAQELFDAKNIYENYLYLNEKLNQYFRMIDEASQKEIREKKTAIDDLIFNSLINFNEISGKSLFVKLDALLENLKSKLENQLAKNPFDNELISEIFYNCQLINVIYKIQIINIDDDSQIKQLQEKMRYIDSLSDYTGIALIPLLNHAETLFEQATNTYLSESKKTESKRKFKDIFVEIQKSYSSFKENHQKLVKNNFNLPNSIQIYFEEIKFRLDCRYLLAKGKHAYLNAFFDPKFPNTKEHQKEIEKYNQFVESQIDSFREVIELAKDHLQYPICNTYIQNAMLNLYYTHKNTPPIHNKDLDKKLNPYRNSRGYNTTLEITIIKLYSLDTTLETKLPSWLKNKNNVSLFNEIIATKTNYQEILETLTKDTNSKSPLEQVIIAHLKLQTLVIDYLPKKIKDYQKHDFDTVTKEISKINNFFSTLDYTAFQDRILHDFSAKSLIGWFNIISINLSHENLVIDLEQIDDIETFDTKINIYNEKLTLIQTKIQFLSACNDLFSKYLKTLLEHLQKKITDQSQINDALRIYEKNKKIISKTLHDLKSDQTSLSEKIQELEEGKKRLSKQQEQKADEHFHSLMAEEVKKLFEFSKNQANIKEEKAKVIQLIISNEDEKENQENKTSENIIFQSSEQEQKINKLFLEGYRALYNPKNKSSDHEKAIYCFNAVCNLTRFTKKNSHTEKHNFAEALLGKSAALMLRGSDVIAPYLKKQNLFIEKTELLKAYSDFEEALHYAIQAMDEIKNTASNELFISTLEIIKFDISMLETKIQHIKDLISKKQKYIEEANKKNSKAQYTHHPEISFKQLQERYFGELTRKISDIKNYLNPEKLSDFDLMAFQQENEQMEKIEYKQLQALTFGAYFNPKTTGQVHNENSISNTHSSPGLFH